MAEDVYYIETDITPQWADDAVSWEPVEHDPFPKPVPIATTRSQAYSDWAKGATIDQLMELGPYLEPQPARGTPESEARNNRFDYAEGEVSPPLGYAEGDIMPQTPAQDRIAQALALEDMAARSYQRDQPIRERNLFTDPMGQQIGFNVPQQPMTQEDMDQFVQRPPRALDIPSASPAEAWFEEPLWPRGGEPPQPQAKYAPAPNPHGLSGGYGGHGKFFSPWNFRGAYRHSIPF